jgi:hypothetical protein
MKEIQGYSNYLIYPDGRVYSKYINGFMKGRNEGHGYKQVTLWNDRKQKTFRIHRLVATHYIDNPENKPEVDHWNGKRNDNRVENLRWVTSSENGQNTGNYKNNTSGHKNICYSKKHNRYKYSKDINKVRYHKYFKTLKDALCYKFIMSLKIKAKILQI